jgi:hypothetical protein
MGTDQEAHGPEAAEASIRYLHEQAFDAHAEVKCLLVDGERAALEANFVGTHVGEFYGKSPTGKRVSVPYTVMYDLSPSIGTNLTNRGEQRCGAGQLRRPPLGKRWYGSQPRPWQSRVLRW